MTIPQRVARIVINEGEDHVSGDGKNIDIASAIAQHLPCAVSTAPDEARSEYSKKELANRKQTISYRANTQDPDHFVHHDRTSLR